MAVDTLINLLERTDDNNLRWSISDALGEIGDKAIDTLINLLERTDDNNLRWRISFKVKAKSFLFSKEFPNQSSQFYHITISEWISCTCNINSTRFSYWSPLSL
ncbi:MAG: hypothetical protein AYK19_03475 [Theionarchaea archaeon DG-70-1]|nr:MAG: hypothetical protein AYK19_03475 [Theionarchaea archaeon DG-70-1]